MYLGTCIQAILNQTFRDFELIFIDDSTNDSTQKILNNFTDGRIKYFKNFKTMGIAKSRNKGLSHSSGQYVFFTDVDCIVAHDWLEKGLASFENEKCIGVEGKIYYVSPGFKPTFSDHVCQNRTGGHFMTGNVAYKRKIIVSLGGFDESYSYHEDRDLALKVQKYGPICFNPEMVVFVQRETTTPKDLIRRSSQIRNRVNLYKKHSDKFYSFGRIVYPWNFVQFLYPPLIFLNVLISSFKCSDDWKLLPFQYVRVFLERLNLWHECARQRVFLL